jgi:uroporphyrinogen decarboxylase
MTPRSRVLKTLSHEEPDRVPIDIGATRSTGINAIAYNNLKKYLKYNGRPTKLFDILQQLAWIDDDVLKYFNADVKPVHRVVQDFGIKINKWKRGELTDGSPASVPENFEPLIEEDCIALIQDENIIAKRPKEGFYFDRVYHPLANVDSIQDLKSSFKWEKISQEETQYLSETASAIRKETDYAIIGNFGGSLLETSHKLRGFEQFMLDLASDRKFAEYLLDLLVESHLQDLETYINAIGVDADIIQFSDDFGSQEGMLISPQLYRDVFKPRERKMWNFVKKNSKYAIFLHSCGSVYRIIPDLIEAGLDIINPVQISARDMEPERLKQEFGNDLVFWGGGCDTQSVLPRGSLKDIEEEVKKNISIFAQGGGFVFAPVHNIQADITAERITKLYESARIHGGYAMK